MTQITRLKITGKDIRRLRYSAYGDQYTPTEIMDIVIRYETLYEVREVPVSIDRFVRLLRDVTGWPIVVGKTGMKRWIEYVPSEEDAKGSEAYRRRGE